MSSRDRPPVASLAATLLLLVGCAAGVRELDLPLPGETEMLPNASPRLALGRVEDVRHFERVSEHRDREGKLRWRGVSRTPVADWLRHAITGLLRARGVGVVPPDEHPDLILDLRLREGLVDTRRDRRKAEVALLAWIRCGRDGRVLALAPLRGRAREARTDATSDGSTLLAALDRALDDLVAELATCPTCSAEPSR